MSNRNVIKVLLIDDDEDDYIILKRFLNKVEPTQYKVDWVSKFRDSLKHLEHVTHDIILVDYFLDENTGIDVINEADRLGVTKPVIILTGQKDADLGIQAMRAGAEDYLIKGTVNEFALERAIRYAIERKQARLRHEELLRKQAEQQLSEKRKDEFISMASHELKTPLTSMKLFLEVLQKEIEKSGNEKSLKYLQRIKDQAEKLRELVSELLDVSRIETGKLRFSKENFRLDELIFDTLEGLQPAARKHELILKKKEPLTVVGDRFRIYQVITNLITNATKYSPEGKNIEIRVEKDTTNAIVSVKDYGIGIEPAQYDKIFEKLYQVTDPNAKTFPGLGMGLYISKEIMKRHNGKIWVKSKKGKGSTFYFSLPLAV